MTILNIEKIAIESGIELNKLKRMSVSTVIKLSEKNEKKKAKEQETALV